MKQTDLRDSRPREIVVPDERVVARVVDMAMATRATRPFLPPAQPGVSLAAAWRLHDRGPIDANLWSCDAHALAEDVGATDALGCRVELGDYAAGVLCLGREVERPGRLTEDRVTFLQDAE